MLGNTVAVDHQDERKLASAANLARTDEQVIALTWRQQYQDQLAAGWSHYRDGKQNSNTGTTTLGPRCGSHEPARSLLQLGDRQFTGPRRGQRSLRNSKDRPQPPGAATAAGLSHLLQATADNASTGLNPLGLSPGAVAFDIDPAWFKAGESHYEQVYERALTAVLNAKGAFDWQQP